MGNLNKKFNENNIFFSLKIDNFETSCFQGEMF